MGWSHGTDLIIKVWGHIREHIAEDRRIEILSNVILDFGNHDWDCEGEIIGEWPEALPALKLAYPDWSELDEITPPASGQRRQGVKRDGS